MPGVPAMFRPLLLGIATFPLAVPAAADWRLFRGNPAQDGVADAKLPDKLDLVWEFTTKGAVEGAVAIADGIVYVGSWDKHLYAIDLKDGKEKWKTKLAPFKASPVVHNGRVYAGDVDGVFYCVNAADGKVLWKFETQGEITSGANFSDDRILIGSHDSTLYCLDKDGKQLWDFKIEGPVNGSPAVANGRT